MTLTRLRQLLSVAQIRKDRQRHCLDLITFTATAIKAADLCMLRQ
jgi:hypothetical protein